MSRAEQSTEMTYAEWTSFNRDTFHALLGAEINVRYYGRRAKRMSSYSHAVTVVSLTAQTGAALAIIGKVPWLVGVTAAMTVVMAVVSGVSGWSKREGNYRLASILADDQKQELEKLRFRTSSSCPSQDALGELHAIQNLSRYVDHLSGELEGNRKIIDKIKADVVEQYKSELDAPENQPEPFNTMLEKA